VAREDITVEYTYRGVVLSAHIQVERDDMPLLVTAPSDGEAAQASSEDIDWIHLRDSDVKSKNAFSTLLKRHARATDAVEMWCYPNVWLDLLELLMVTIRQHPLPDVVQWPSEGGTRG
jgi:hypothetical protein